VRIKEGDPRGRHVVIVDDLVQSGGTLVECQVPNNFTQSPFLQVDFHQLLCLILIFHFSILFI
jgi:hypothetical protein